jgi:glutamate carboxypeptidase
VIRRGTLNEINMQAIRGYIDEHRDEMIADLKAFVERETPSEEKGLLDAFAGYLAEYAEHRAGGYATVLAHGMAGNQVRVEWGEHEGKPPILLLGHYDTVWPAGALEAMPFAVHGDTARGPGIFDMKCGLAQDFWGIKALREAGWIAKWFSCATQTKSFVAHTPVLS